MINGSDLGEERLDRRVIGEIDDLATRRVAQLRYSVIDFLTIAGCNDNPRTCVIRLRCYSAANARRAADDYDQCVSQGSR
jgi:hypothetical protein